jgi:hypothetical protein
MLPWEAEMTAVQTLEEMVAAAPVHENEAAPDFSGIEEAFSTVGVSPSDVLAVSQCQFGKANIEALVDDDTIAFVHPTGVLCTSGKRKLIGKAVKFGEVKFAQCRGFAPCEYTDDRGFGKFGIEFGGAGGVLLGRVYWRWKAKRFRDSTVAIMGVAEERDRILGVVEQLLS